MYKFRAECNADAQLIRTILLPWVREWSEKRGELRYRGEKYPSSEVEVGFCLDDGAPTLAEMVWIFDKLENCHFAVQTLAFSSQYTGIRNRDAPFLLGARPSTAVLETIRLRLVRRQKLLSAECERTGEAHRAFSQVLKLGHKWKEREPGDARPGFVVPVVHEPTGLTAICIVAAPGGRLPSEKKAQAVVQARMLLLQD